ncbi:MAG TPA: type II toxin-antitoxin system death-on-curing family toxin [Myxococcota bacterium]|nr:type II toxin-antitoxin system death-on-curing family toxin [Myxococcota bacterium]
MIHLSKRFVIAYHARLIELFGGSHGVRDDGLLDSALAQPQATFDGEPLHADVWEVAAAYAFHLIRNHAFVDGNKRIAAVAMGAFLEVNGAPLRVEELELYATVIALAKGELSKQALAAWLRSRAPGR